MSNPQAPSEHSVEWLYFRGLYHLQRFGYHVSSDDEGPFCLHTIQVLSAPKLHSGSLPSRNLVPQPIDCTRLLEHQSRIECILDTTKTRKGTETDDETTNPIEPEVAEFWAPLMHERPEGTPLHTFTMGLLSGKRNAPQRLSHRSPLLATTEELRARLDRSVVRGEKADELSFRKHPAGGK